MNICLLPCRPQKGPHSSLRISGCCHNPVLGIRFCYLKFVLLLIYTQKNYWTILPYKRPFDTTGFVMRTSVIFTKSHSQKFQSYFFSDRMSTTELKQIMTVCISDRRPSPCEPWWNTPELQPDSIRSLTRSHQSALSLSSALPVAYVLAWSLDSNTKCDIRYDD